MWYPGVGGRGITEELCHLKLAVLDDAIPRKRDIPMNYRKAKALMFMKVRTSLGLDNCHSFLSGAAPLSHDVSEFFLSLDIPIGEIYRMSESSGPHTASSKSKYRVLRYQAAVAPSPKCHGVRS